MESCRVGGIEWHFCWGGEKKQIFLVYVQQKLYFFVVYIVFDIVFVVAIVMYQNLHVMVTSFGCCLYSGVPPRVPVVLGFCSVWEKMGM